jgi:Zn finger protein HypA/HybF involved in hydrogenase expression
MMKYENDCCGCTSVGLPCLGSMCGKRRTPHYYCDKCKEETTLYKFDGKELCPDCILEQLQVVEGSE